MIYPYKFSSIWVFQVRNHILCNVLEYFQEMDFHGEDHFHFEDELRLKSLDRLQQEVIEIEQKELNDVKNQFSQMQFPGAVGLFQYILYNLNTLSVVRFHENIKSLRYIINNELKKPSFYVYPSKRCNMV